MAKISSIGVTILIIVLFCAGTVSAQSKCGPNEDLVCEDWEELRKLLVFDPKCLWTSTDGPDSSWDPIKVSSEGYVQELDLGNCSLEGQLPFNGSGLSQMSFLRLYRNNLTGDLSLFSKFPSLKTLFLSYNKFSGNLEPFRTLRFEKLGLNGNALNGTLDPLQQMTDLVELNVGENDISGDIPGFITSFSNLTSLILGGNQITGQIPTDIGRLNQLQTLFLQGNTLEGPLPASMSALTSLRQLDLSGNQLSGGLGEWLGTFTALTKLDLDRNLFQGPLPKSMKNLVNLGELHLWANWFNGSLAPIRGLPLHLSCLISQNLFDCPASFQACCQGYSDNPAPPPAPVACYSSFACECSSNLVDITDADCQSGSWYVNGSTNNAGAVTVGAADQIVITGNFTQTSDALLEIYHDQQRNSSAIIVGGNVQLDGTLVVNLDGDTPDNITIITAQNITGNFSNVVINQTAPRCHHINAQLISNKGQVLLGLTDNNDCGKFPKKVVIITVSSVGGGIILIILATVALIIIKNKRKPGQTGLLWSFVSRKHLAQPSRDDFDSRGP